MKVRTHFVSGSVTPHWRGAVKFNLHCSMMIVYASITVWYREWKNTHQVDRQWWSWTSQGWRNRYGWRIQLPVYSLSRRTALEGRQSQHWTAAASLSTQFPLYPERALEPKDESKETTRLSSLVIQWERQRRAHSISYLSVSYVKVQHGSSTIIALLKRDGEGVSFYFHLIGQHNWAVWFTYWQEAKTK